MDKLHEFKYKTSQSAWTRLNKFLAMNENYLKKVHGINKFSTQLMMFNVFGHIQKSWVEPDFDFGRMFGYKIHKWRGLVNNYVDMNYLDLVRSDILTREAKRNKNYSLSFHFSNTHSNGKDCLISIIFSRKPGYDWPILTFHTRATELTKRFLIDLLLVHRIGEYVYGSGSHFSVNFYIPYCYITCEAFSMFDTYRSIDKFVAEVKDKGEFQERILKVLHKYKTVNPDEIRYKSHRRAVKQLQTTPDGIALSKTPPLLAGGLYLNAREQIKYPEDCKSEVDRKLYRDKLNIR